MMCEEPEQHKTTSEAETVQKHIDLTAQDALRKSMMAASASNDDNDGNNLIERCLTHLHLETFCKH